MNINLSLKTNKKDKRAGALSACIKKSSIIYTFKSYLRKANTCIVPDIKKEITKPFKNIFTLSQPQEGLPLWDRKVHRGHIQGWRRAFRPNQLHSTPVPPLRMKKNWSQKQGNRPLNFY